MKQFIFINVKYVIVNFKSNKEKNPFSILLTYKFKQIYWLFNYSTSHFKMSFPFTVLSFKSKIKVLFLEPNNYDIVHSQLPIKSNLLFFSSSISIHSNFNYYYYSK